VHLTPTAADDSSRSRAAVIALEFTM